MNGQLNRNAIISIIACSLLLNVILAIRYGPFGETYSDPTVESESIHKRPRLRHPEYSHETELDADLLAMLDPEAKILVKRAATLLKAGKSKEIVIAAILPSINRHYDSELMRLKRDEVRSKGSLINDIREGLIRGLFGVDFRSPDPFNTTVPEFRFDAGGGQKAGEIISKVAGVNLQDFEKVRLVAIAGKYEINSPGFADALHEELGAKSEELILSMNPDYQWMYKLCFGISDDNKSRAAMAQKLQTIREERDYALRQWNNADITDVERAIGVKSVENQIMELVKDRVGVNAVAVISANGWKQE